VTVTNSGRGAGGEAKDNNNCEGGGEGGGGSEGDGGSEGEVN